MKIFKLKAVDNFKPPSQKNKYPPGNEDYGVEQDFEKYIDKKPELLTDIPDEADWHYLPIYWTRWHVAHEYATSGLEELQREVDRMIINDEKTFTVCQYDDGPVVDVGKTLQFLSSRKTEVGIDIPLLRNSIRKNRWVKPRKKYLAYFSGRLKNHPLRKQMAQKLINKKAVLVIDEILSQNKFRNLMEESYVALCPRGYGGSSFRFYEAMDLGVVPMLIGEKDVRPFKKMIVWENCSLYAKSIEEISPLLESVEVKTLVKMGEKAREVYDKFLCYGKWCELAIKELKHL